MIYRDERHQRTFEKEAAMRPESISRPLLAALYLLTADRNLWDQVKDQMVYDLYLRENLKSRPGFARDQKPFERQVWDFRKREKVAKNAHVEVFADGTVLLFNYADRDPLTNNAHVTDVTKDVFENLNRD